MGKGAFQVTEKTDDLATAVEAAYDKAHGPSESLPAEPAPASSPEPEVAAPSTEPAATTASPDRVRDDKGRFLPKEATALPIEGAPVGRAEAGSDLSQVPEPAKAAAPAEPAAKDPTTSWPAGDRDMFKNLPELAQKFLLRRHREMEAGFTQKTQAVAHLREYEPVAELFAPYQAQLKMAGLSAGQVIQRWAAAEQALQQDAKGTLVRLAHMYGIDPKELAGAPALASQEPAQGGGPSWLEGDPVVQQLRNQVGQSQAHIAQFMQNQAMGQIQSFADMRDSKGSLAHPYFEKVVDEMIALTQTERAAGRTPDLEAIYSKACWANPEAREELLAGQRDAQRRDDARKSQEKAAASAKAGISVGSGAPLPGTDRPAPQSLDKTIAEAWNRAHR